MKLRLKTLSLRLLVTLKVALVATPMSALADDSIKALTQTCVACHGQNGVALHNEWPSLAGQKSGYLLAQLRAFKSGTRQNALMANQLNNFNDDDLKAIAQYYASLPFVKEPADNINHAGENVRANCIACHGRKGKTVNDTWPNLAGQNKDYLFKQLKDFSSKTRESMIMNVIASELTEQQMKDVAQYYEQVGSEQ